MTYTVINPKTKKILYTGTDKNMAYAVCYEYQKTESVKMIISDVGYMETDLWIVQ